MPNPSLFSRLCTPHLLLLAWEQVKSKNAAGGVDKRTVGDFAKNLAENVQSIIAELKSGMWKPQPYLCVEIPKKTNEKRRLGLLTVKDKVIQQAIKMLIEPKFEATFFPCSYGYRKEKGALRAVKRTQDACRQKKLRFALKLDIDNFFDNIDHTILQKRVDAIVKDEEIVRLIMLCTKMGVVSKQLLWTETTKGVPQGAVLSPLLANLYLNSFDQCMLSKTDNYVRYADDFVLLCKTEEEAAIMQQLATNYLKDKLLLSLNEPVTKSIDEGFEFLGVVINRKGCSVTDDKKAELIEKIQSLKLFSDGFSVKDTKKWEGITRYYAQLLSEPLLQELDKVLLNHLMNEAVQSHQNFANRNILLNLLGKFRFLSVDFQMRDKELKKAIADSYVDAKRLPLNRESEILNKKIIQQRKHEYQKMEEANAELLVATPGSYLGSARGNVVVKNKGLVIATAPTANLKHITIVGEGVSFSSNLLNLLNNHKITLDLFNHQGKHLGGFLRASSSQCELWMQQSSADVVRRNTLAASIIEGKVINQLYLAKYFNKYHKNSHHHASDLLEKLGDTVKLTRHFVGSADKSDMGFVQQLMAQEAQCALNYWAYVKDLLSDDNVGFDGREQQGAVDVVNVMLNYGYALLYARVWRALLGNGLNPYDSVIHARQSGKPTLVYDVVELFRTQAVDRVVFSLVQKKESISVENGLLQEDSKKLLVKNLLERIQKRENYRSESISLDRIIWRQCNEIAQYFSANAKFKPYKSKW